MNDVRGAHPGAVAMVATAFLLVVIIGWSIGWVAAGAKLPASAGGPSTAVSSSHAGRGDPTAGATRTPTGAATASPTGADGIPSDAFGMPDLIGLPFAEARRVAWSTGLEVTLVFGKEGVQGTVIATKPVANILVRPGYRISLHVAGPAPKLQVPGVAGQSCADATQHLIEAGLRVSGYPSGNKGIARYTSPKAGTYATWNDRVEIFCTAASESPADSAA